ncbi:MAG: hypothetical protein H0X31_00885 [Nostocaceae cyanobacterium]|nr:hypothetical protein [Nostocaceae cyanobacterium]
MTISFNSLAPYLPPGSLEFVGNNQVKLNLNTITGDNLSLDSDALKCIVLIVNALSDMTEAINKSRIAQNLAPIVFVSKHLVGNPDSPVFDFVLSAAINPASFINNLMSPDK